MAQILVVDSRGLASFLGCCELQLRFPWVAVDKFELSYHNKEAFLFHHIAVLLPHIPTL